MCKLCQNFNLAHMNNEVSTAIIQDTRRVKKDGTFPVKLRVTYQRKRKYYPRMNLTEEEFKKVMGEKPRGEAKQISNILQTFEVKARRIIDKMEVFSFQAFERQFLNDTPAENKQDVFAALDRYIEELQREGKAGTANSYLCTLRSLKSYKRKLTFAEITPELLKDYEKWMISKGKSTTTVGIYLRQLRAIFNEAIAAGNVSKELYPFGRRRYQIPAGRNTKKALSIKDVSKLFSHTPSTPSEGRYFALWKFSYLCNGMNIKDVLRLKYRNIQGDNIIFVREKTKNTTRSNSKTIQVYFRPEAKSIVEQLGAEPIEPDNFIFPYLWKGIDPKRELEIKRQVIKNVNKYARRIGEKLRIEKDITTYTARHSYATILKHSNASIEYISESLGHSDLRTTESYLDSFEDDVRREYSDMLVNFGDE